jgi:hypothetical protein
MKKESLLQTNPYLKHPEIASRLIERSVITSCGVEGIKVDFNKVADFHIPQRSNKRSAGN